MTAVRWHRLVLALLLLVCALSSRPFGSMEQAVTAGREISQPPALLVGARIAHASFCSAPADVGLDYDDCPALAFRSTTLTRSLERHTETGRGSSQARDTTSGSPATLSNPPPFRSSEAIHLA
jgi:hypothetical protein